jgi:phosphohistidine phosphatase
MKTVLLLRHAKSSWDDPGLDDHDRPLNNRGRRDAPRMGDLLKAEQLVPECIVSSSARRARKTATIVAERCGFEGEIQLSDELYHAAPAEYFRLLSQLPTECRSVLVVGHNPGFEEFLSRLAGAHHSLPTAALAQVEVEIDDWRDFRPGTAARLVNLWRPKELGE